MTGSTPADLALEKIRQLVVRHNAIGLNDAQVADLVDAINQLDTWIEEGKRLPYDWRRATGCRRPLQHPLASRRAMR